jgi:RNA polymerase primary sigma factor
VSTTSSLEYVTPMTFIVEEGFQFESPREEEAESPPGDGTPTDKTPWAGEGASFNDLGYFMTVAGSYSLLTAADERALGLAVWRGRCRLLRILRRARKCSGRRRIALDIELPRRPVTASTRRRLARVERLARAVSEQGAPSRPTRFPAAGLKGAKRRLRSTLATIDEARGRLVEHNLRLVVWVAKSFRGRGFDFIDVIQEGCLGLMRAADRFDPRVGARFSTFATHWIQQGIRRALAEKSRTIRIPVNRIPEVRQTLHARARLAAKLGRPPLVEEIAAATGRETAKVEELLPAIAPIDSIDSRIPSTEKLLGETIEDRTSATPLDAAMEEETRRAVKAVLHELPQRQRIILSMRHGIDYPHECTLDEIGDALGLSRERIRQVEKVATASVRDWIKKHRPRLAEPV